MTLECIAFVKARLSEQFLMSDLGPLRYFLTIEVSSTSNGFLISQWKYIQDLACSALADEHIVQAPMELNVHLRASDDEVSIFRIRHANVIFRSGWAADWRQRRGARTRRLCGGAAR